jgi:hypothetical protein
MEDKQTKIDIYSKMIEYAMDKIKTSYEREEIVKAQEEGYRQGLENIKAYYETCRENLSK